MVEEEWKVIIDSISCFFFSSKFTEKKSIIKKEIMCKDKFINYDKSFEYFKGMRWLIQKFNSHEIIHKSLGNIPLCARHS